MVPTQSHKLSLNQWVKLPSHYAGHTGSERKRKESMERKAKGRVLSFFFSYLTALQIKIERDSRLTLGVLGVLSK